MGPRLCQSTSSASITIAASRSFRANAAKMVWTAAVSSDSNIRLRSHSRLRLLPSLAEREFMLSRIRIHADRVAFGKFTLENPPGQRVFDTLLDHALQRP